MGLRQQAALDAQAILEDTSGFGWPFTLTSPLGVATARVGFTTDIGQTIDPDTGQAVAGRRASVAVSLRSLTEMPAAVADGSKKPWLVDFLSALGVAAAFKVIEVLPDRAAGVVVLLLEAYQRRVVFAGALALPLLQLAGTLAPRVALAGALALPSGLLLSGTIAPRVALAGALALPSLQVAGSVAPRVELAGALALPSLLLSGTIAPRVALAGALALPSLQLAGTLTAGANPLTAWYRMALSTPVAGEWQTVVDVFGGASLVQNDTDRRLAAGTSGNGLPIGTYDGSDVMRMPLGANNFNTSKFGLAYWFQPSGASGQYLFVIYNNDAGARVLAFGINATGRMFLQIYIGTNVDGRQYDSANNAIFGSVYSFVRLQIDMTKTSECDTDGATADAKVRIFINETSVPLTPSNIGVGGTLTTLRTPSGAAIFGGINDSDTPVAPVGAGTIHGPDTWIFTATPSAAQGAAYKNFEQPT